MPLTRRFTLTLATMAVITAAGCELIDAPTDPTPSGLDDAITALTVSDEERDGYQRESFSDWRDPDGNGCDTRQEVLIAEELTESATVTDCDGTIPGEWLSVYDGERVTDASELDIDHFVPLAEAWDSGASEWTEERRVDYATYVDDDRHLVAVTASSNRSKGDKDPAEWMPPDSSTHCEYIATWVAIKTQWELTVDKAELDAIREFAADCSGTEVTITPID